MRDKTTHVHLAVLVAALCVVALVAGNGAAHAQISDTASITAPVISENVSRIELIAPVAKDGYRSTAFLRKPPGAGPFPAVLLIHGGLTSRPSELLSREIKAIMPSRFLASGYVVVVVTYRSRDIDPQSKDSLLDVLAALDYVRALPYVHLASVAIYGSSGGGDLALELAAATDVAAVAAEEPATELFAGVLNKEFPRTGDRYSPADAMPIEAEPMRFYTAEFQKLTRAKIETIHAPVLIVQSDQERAVRGFNGQVFIPELRRGGKHVEVITYPGEFHGFAFNGDGRPASVSKAFEDIDNFFQQHLKTKPVAIDAKLVEVTSLPANRRSIFVLNVGGSTQTSLAGVWKEDRLGRESVIVDLKADGTAVKGSLFDFEGAKPIALNEVRIDGDRLTFTAKNPDGSRTVTFTGQRNGDQITLTRAVVSRPGGELESRVFASQGPTSLTLRRAQ